MTTDGPAPRRPPAGRYGPEPTPAARRRRIALVAGALGVGGLGMLGWIGWGVLNDPVQWSPVGYSVRDARSVDVTFDLTADPGTPVRCRVEAQSSAHAQVGLRTVDIEASTERSRRLTVTVATAEQAVTGLVNNCAPAPSPAP